MHKRIYWVVGLSIAVLVATFGFYGFKSYKIHWYITHYQPPAISVSTDKVKAKTWKPFLSAVGSLKASRGVEVNAQVNGQVMSIHFHSGQNVKKGDLLLQQDNLIDQQALQRDQAQLHLNKLDYERKQKLLTNNAVARSIVDASRAAYFKSVAAVASDEVMLNKKQIRAPFSGKLGIRQVDVGEFLTAGKGIVTLQALHPMFVDFSLPEKYLAELHRGQVVDVSVDAYPDEVFKGTIAALNSKIDVGTRSIDVRALVPNEKERLYPGLFANVRVILPKQQNVLTIPQTAVTYSLYGDSVYVVQRQDQDKKSSSKHEAKKSSKHTLIAVQKFVKVGERRGTVVAIKSGLKAGEEVITSGQLKLHPNARVEINNTVQLQ